MTTAAQKVTVKLGVEKKDGGDVLFRRVNLSQHEKYKENLYYVLKLYSIQTYTGGDLLPFTTIGYNVKFIYVDVDGDKVMIGSAEELMDALKMHEDKGIIKIIAGVEQQRDGSTGIVAPERRPSMTSRGAQVSAPEPKPTATISGSIPDAPPQIQQILESVVAQIASIPAIMHLQVRGSGPGPTRTPSVPTPTAPKPTIATDTAAAPTPSSTSIPAPARLFIHGRHTCDGCLTTPIIGQRFHAVNLPDYDLCANCRNNYKGEEITFEPVELDRDRAFQDRWHRRHSRWGPPHDQLGPPPPLGAPDHQGPPPPLGCPPPFGPPPPHHHLWEPHHHHWAPHHGHWGPRHGHCGPRGRWGRGPPVGPHAPFVGPSPEEVDFALKEAIRRSLGDNKLNNDEYLAYKKVLDEADEKMFRDEAEHAKKKLAMKSTTASKAKKTSSAKKTAPVVATIDVEVASAAAPKKKKKALLSVDKDAPVPAVKDEKPLIAEPVLMEDIKAELPKKVATPPGSPSKMSDTSFEDEAEGNGDIAKLVGSTLDKFAAAIDDFNSEFDRALTVESKPDEAAPEEKEIAVEPAKEGTEIVEAEDASDDDISQGSWVVDDEQFASDEALARAAHVIGSALFQSDMIQSVQSAGLVSALSHSENGSNSLSSSADGPSLAPSAMSVPTNPGSVTHYQMDRWAIQLSELHGMGLDDDAKIVEILERLTAANMGSDCDDEVPIERIVDEYYK